MTTQITVCKEGLLLVESYNEIKAIYDEYVKRHGCDSSEEFNLILAQLNSTARSVANVISLACKLS